MPALELLDGRVDALVATVLASGGSNAADAAVAEGPADWMEWRAGRARRARRARAPGHLRHRPARALGGEHRRPHPDRRRHAGGHPRVRRAHRGRALLLQGAHGRGLARGRTARALRGRPRAHRAPGRAGGAPRAAAPHPAGGRARGARAVELPDEARARGQRRGARHAGERRPPARRHARGGLPGRGRVGGLRRAHPRAHRHRRARCRVPPRGPARGGRGAARRRDVRGLVLGAGRTAASGDRRALGRAAGRPLPRRGRHRGGGLARWATCSSPSSRRAASARTRWRSTTTPSCRRPTTTSRPTGGSTGSSGPTRSVHLGKHGTLEWLPGKGLGLSAACAPDAALGAMPLLYPFVVNDPGEGEQAKRRAHAVVVDHLIPPMARADTYDELARLEQLLDEYFQAEGLDPSKLPAIGGRIWELLREAELHRDLEVEERPEDFGAVPHPPRRLPLRDQGPPDPRRPARARRRPRGRGPARAARRRSCASEPARCRGCAARSARPSGSTSRRCWRGGSTRRHGGHGWGRPTSRAAPAGRLDPAAAAPAGRLDPATAAAAAPLVERFPGPAASPADLVDRLDEAQRALLLALEARGFDPAAAEQRGGRRASARPTRAWSAPCASPPPTSCRASPAPRTRSTTSCTGCAAATCPPGPPARPPAGGSTCCPTGRNFYSVDPKAAAVGAGLRRRAAPRRGPLRPPPGRGRRAARDGRHRRLGHGGHAHPGRRRRRDPRPARRAPALGARVAPGRRARGRSRSTSSAAPRIDVTVRISGFFRDAFPNLVTLMDEAVRLGRRASTSRTSSTSCAARPRGRRAPRGRAGRDRRLAARHRARLRLQARAPTAPASCR